MFCRQNNVVKTVILLLYYIFAADTFEERKFCDNTTANQAILHRHENMHFQGKKLQVFNTLSETECSNRCIFTRLCSSLNFISDELVKANNKQTYTCELLQETDKKNSGVLWQKQGSVYNVIVMRKETDCKNGGTCLYDKSKKSTCQCKQINNTSIYAGHRCERTELGIEASDLYLKMNSPLKAPGESVAFPKNERNLERLVKYSNKLSLVYSPILKRNVTFFSGETESYADFELPSADCFSAVHTCTSGLSIVVWLMLHNITEHPKYEKFQIIAETGDSRDIGFAVAFYETKLVIQIIKSHYIYAIEKPLSSNVTGNWHHFAVVYQKDGTTNENILLFLDGNIVTKGRGNAGTTVSDEFKFLRIGKSIYPGTCEAARVSMSHLGIWKTALTQQDIMYLYKMK